MDAAVVFRTLRPSDAPACARLHAGAFAQPWSAVDFHDQISRPDCVLTGAAVPAPILVGFASSRFIGEEADLLTIAVDRERRGRGIGSALLRNHLSGLSDAGVRTVFLEVGAGNDAARALYRTLGFVPVGCRKGYYPAAGGARENAVAMRCDL